MCFTEAFTFINALYPSRTPGLHVGSPSFGKLGNLRLNKCSSVPNLLQFHNLVGIRIKRDDPHVIAQGLSIFSVLRWLPFC